jgi:hypothetical protein
MPVNQNITRIEVKIVTTKGVRTVTIRPPQQEVKAILFDLDLENLIAPAIPRIRAVPSPAELQVQDTIPAADAVAMGPLACYLVKSGLHCW